MLKRTGAFVLGDTWFIGNGAEDRVASQEWGEKGRFAGFGSKRCLDTAFR